MLGALGVVALAAAVGVANVVAAQRATERAERLSALDGVVAPFAAPLTATWEATTALGASWTDGLVLRWQDLRDGVELQALDPATGAVLWTVPRGFAGRAPQGVDWCERVAGGPERPVVLCWRVSPVVVENPDGTTSTFEGELVVLDAADGSVVAEHPIALPSSGYDVLDGDVVLGYRAGDVVRVVRTDPVSAVPVWERELPLTARQPDGSPSAWLTVEHGLVVVHGPTTVVLDADGATLGSWDIPPVDTQGASVALEGAVVGVTDQGFGTWADVVGRTRTSTGTWHDRTGAAVTPLEGFLAEPEVTDGSASHVVLTASAGQELRATDARTGQVPWTRAFTGGEVLVRRDGSAVVADDRRVFSLDVLTGTEEWSVPVAGARPDLGTVTDGERVLLLAQDSGRWLLHAVSLDGIPLWTSAVPAAAALPDVVGGGRPVLVEVRGTVVLDGAQTMIGLG